MIMVDGKAYRFIGPEPASVPAARQLARFVSPTNSSYQFMAGEVGLTIDFLTPLRNFFSLGEYHVMLTLTLNLIQGIQGIQHPGYEGMDPETSSG